MVSVHLVDGLLGGSGVVSWFGCLVCLFVCLFVRGTKYGQRFFFSFFFSIIDEIASEEKGVGKEKG